MQQLPPGREIRREPKAKERQHRFRDHRLRDAKRRRHHDGRHHVGQDVAQNDPARRRADGPRCQHKFPLFQGQHLAPHHAGALHPACQANRQNDQHKGAKLWPHDPAQRLAKQHHHDQQKRQQRQRQEQIDQPHQDIVQPFEIPRQQADRGANDHRDQHRRQTHGQRHLAPRHHPRQKIAAQLIGAQRVVKAWGQVAGLEHLDGIGFDKGRVNAPDKGTDDHKHHQPQQHRCAHHCTLVVLELIPDIPPLIAGRAQGLFVNGIDTGISHSGSSGQAGRR